MAATKTARTIIAAGTTNGAGSTTTGTALDLTTKYGGFCTVKITNGGTGPTVAAQANVMVSHDNTNWKTWQTLVASTTNSAVNEWGFVIPMGVMYFRVDVTGNTAQAVTCECFVEELTTG